MNFKFRASKLNQKINYFYQLRGGLRQGRGARAGRRASGGVNGYFGTVDDGRGDRSSEGRLG